MTTIAPTAIIRDPSNLQVGQDVIVMDYSVIGLPNYYPDVFDQPEQRNVVIGDRTRIYPWSLVYEGARLGSDVLMEERTSVGSRTYVGARTRILYQAQVNDKITIGEECIIGGFVADNCCIGNRCSVFGALVHCYVQPSLTAWDTTDEIGPVLDDDVIVGWGAVLIGPIKIGRGAKIYPNSVVTCDVPSGEKYGKRS